MKDHLLGKQLQSATSLASSFNTAAVSVINMENIFVTIETASVVTNAGTFVPQIRVKKSLNEYSGWISLTLDTPVILANADIATVINLRNLPPCELRIAYTKSSGVVDGTVTIWVSGREA